MEVFSTQTQKPTAQVFKLPVERPVFKLPKATENRDRALYPFVTNLPKEEVDAHMDAGILGPLVDKAEVGNKAKQQEIVTTVLEDQPEDMTVAIDELEAARNENPFLKQFVSPATLAALKQSDSPLARKVAQTKLANAAIAIEVIEKFTSEAEEADTRIPLGPVLDTSFALFGGLTTQLADSMVSDLPILSSINVAKRKDLANRFVSTLDSNADPAVIRSELEAIVAEAADQGLFTQNNKFYLADFLALVSEGTTGSEAVLQETLGAMDTTIGIASWLGDAARVLARTRRGTQAVVETINDAIKADNAISGHSTVMDLTEGVTKSSVVTPISRTPDEATAFLEANLNTKSYEMATAIRAASGQSISDEAFEAFRVEFLEQMKVEVEKSGQKRYIDADLTIDEFENIQGIQIFGTSKGRAYTNEKVAIKEAEKLGGEVIKASDGSGWVIKKVTNIPNGMFYGKTNAADIFNELRLYETTDPARLGEGFFTKYLWSPLSQTTETLNAINKQGESARAKAQAIFDKEYAALVSSVDKKSLQAINVVLEDIDKGSRAAMRRWLTGPEFDQAFFELNKRLPTEKEKAIYLEHVSRKDTEWALTADYYFKREVNQGLKVYKFNEIEVKGAEVAPERIPDQMVWSEDAGRYVKVADLPKGSKVVRLVEPQTYGGKFTNYVATTKPRERALRPTDSLGYNPGGRLYLPNQTNFILKQSQEVELADGAKMQGRPITIMVAKTLKEVRQAEDKLNRIIKALHEKVNPNAFDKASYVRAVTGLKDKALDDLIAEVSDWNPNVHSLKTFGEFFEDMNLDLRRTVDFTEDGKPLITGDTFVGDLTWRDALGAPGILKSGNVRRDRALIGYGGTPVPTVPPLEAAQRTVMASVMRSTNAAYEAAAVQGLIKGLIQGTPTLSGKKVPLVSADTLESIRNLGYRQKLKFLEGKIYTNSAEGRKLELERQKILYRLEQQSYLDAGFAKLKDRMANWLYDKEWKKTAGFIDKHSPEPFAAMRGIVFDAYLGLGAPDQLWVQASQIVNVIALSDGFNGVRSVAAMPIVRALIVNGHKAPTMKMAETMAPLLGMKPQQFIDMVEELKANGRVNVAASLADLGEDSAGKVAFRKVREYGRVFYNEGELSARITAHISASMEFLKKNPDGVLTSNAARRYVMHKSDEFTNAMTSQSRTGIEQLPMMQFMSYSMRMFEYLFGGTMGGKKALTVKQRVRLFGTQLALYGMSAVPFIGWYMDYFNFKNGTNLNEQDYATLREGLIDGLIQYATGVETEVGRRLAWGEGFYNTISDMSTQPIWQTLLGPSGSLLGDVAASTSRLFYNIETGGWSFAPQDVGNILRNVKSVNLGYNTIQAIRTGEFYSKKSNQQVVDGLDGFEIAAIALGIPLEKVNETWRDIQHLSRDGKYHRDIAKRIEDRFNLRAYLLEHEPENYEQIEAIEKQIEFIYAAELADPYMRREVTRYINPSVLSLQEEVMMRILRTNNERRNEVMQ